MIIVAFHVEVKPGHEDAFIEGFKNRPKLVEEMKGFVSAEVVQNSASRNQFIVLNKWDSVADFEAWTQSEAFSAAHQRSGVPTVSTRLEIHEVVA